MNIKRVSIIIAMMALSVAASVIFGVKAYANGTGNQYAYCNPGCAFVNAWGGGPWVNVYLGGQTVNNDFTLVYNNNTGYYNIEDTDGGPYNGYCVADANNSSGDARTALNACGTAWGSNFIIGNLGCGSGYEWFYNTHWGGYLSPANNYVNGSHFYLNNPNINCFRVYGAA